MRRTFAILTLLFLVSLFFRSPATVFAHPFFAVSDQLGNYEIRGLPAGTYKLVAWHERLGEQEMEITVVPNESRKIDFTFEVLEKHRSIAGSSLILNPKF